MRIYVLNAIAGGLETVRIFAREQPVAGYIGLSPERDNRDVAGFVDGRAYCSDAGIPYHEVCSYPLSDPRDRALIDSLDIDVLVVTGWQRLVPEWLIESCKSVLGFHGSPLGITEGRGRSPQNWALMRQWPSFELSVFRIAPGIDNGAILASRRFTYNLRDDIGSSYLKVSYIAAQLLLELAAAGRLASDGEAQDEDGAQYLPQRLPGDGQIDWRRPASAVVDFVRALTRPYPGAFTVHAGRRIAIWDALAFEAGSSFDRFQPGALVHRYGSGELLVRCGAGAVIVRDHDYDGEADGALTFDSADHEAQLAAIVARHREKYPRLPLAERLFAACSADSAD